MLGGPSYEQPHERESFLSPPALKYSLGPEESWSVVLNFVEESETAEHKLLHLLPNTPQVPSTRGAQLLTKLNLKLCLFLIPLCHYICWHWIWRTQSIEQIKARA